VRERLLHGTSVISSVGRHRNHKHNLSGDQYPFVATSHDVRTRDSALASAPWLSHATAVQQLAEEAAFVAPVTPVPSHRKSIPSTQHHICNRTLRQICNWDGGQQITPQITTHSPYVMWSHPSGRSTILMHLKHRCQRCSAANSKKSCKTSSAGQSPSCASLGPKNGSGGPGCKGAKIGSVPGEITRKV